MRSSLLITLAIALVLAVFAKPMISADQNVTVTTTVTAIACAQTTSECTVVSTVYLQALEILLLVVLSVAVVVIIFLIRLYRRTKF